MKGSYVSEIKILERRFTGICRDLLSKYSENTVLGRNEAVQMFFLTPTRNTFLTVLWKYGFIMFSELRFVK